MLLVSLGRVPYFSVHVYVNQRIGHFEQYGESGKVVDESGAERSLDRYCFCFLFRCHVWFGISLETEPE
jgi:hypothetical protein